MSQLIDRITRINADDGPVRSAADKTICPPYFLVTLVLILTAGLSLRLWNLGTASLWTDEVTSAYRAESTLSESVQSIMRAGNQMPLYFFALRVMPATSDFMLRLPSALLGASGIVLLVLVVLALYDNHELALVAGALLAVNPFHVWLSRTARYYTLIFVLALAVSFCFLWLLRGHRTRRVWIAFTLTSILAYMTHYTTLALPAAQLVTIVVVSRVRDDRFFRKWCIVQGVAVIPVTIWLGILAQSPPDVGPEWVPVPDLYDIPQTLWHLTIGHSTSWQWNVIVGRVIIAGTLIAGIRYAVHDHGTYQENLHWLALVSFPLVVVFTISIAAVSFYVDRYFMILLPGLILLLAQGIHKLPPRIGQVILAAIMITCTLHILASFRNGDYVREDWQGAATFIAHNMRPGDEVLVDRTNVEQAFLRYFPTPSPSTPTVTHLDSGIDEVLFEPSIRRIWVIYRNPHEDVHREGVMPSFDPFEPGHTPLGNWLADQRNQVILTRTFNGVTVLLLHPAGKQHTVDKESFPTKRNNRTTRPRGPV